MGDNSSSPAIFIIVIIIIFIFLMVSAGIIYYVWDKSDSAKEDIPIVYDSFIVRAFDYNNVQINNISYLIKQENTYTQEIENGSEDYEITITDSQIVEQGMLYSDSLEKFTHASNTSNYSIAAWNEDYYYLEKICSLNDDKCSVILDRIGEVSFNIVNVYDNIYRVIIYPHSGIVKNPNICLAWKNLYDVTMPNLTLMSVPESNLGEYDKCYSLGTDMQSDTFYEFEIQYDKQPISIQEIDERYFEVFFNDDCKNPTGDCIDTQIIKIYIEKETN